MARRMPKKLDRKKFSRDARKGMKDPILSKGLVRGGPRI